MELVGLYLLIDVTFSKNTDKTCLRVPLHAFSSHYSNDFVCYTGYKKSASGRSCIETDLDLIPKNSHRVDNGWVCNTDFYRNPDASGCLPAPYCTTSPYDSNTLYCKDECELNTAGNGCDKKPSIPENSHIVDNGWVCNTDFYKSGLACRRVPANAYSKYNSNYWYCNTGYKKNSNKDACISSTPTTKTTKKNDDDLRVVVIIIIIVFVGWLMFKPSSSKPTPRPQLLSQVQDLSQSQVQDLSQSQVQDLQPKPIPKPEPKPEQGSRRDIDLQTVLIEDW